MSRKPLQHRSSLTIVGAGYDHPEGIAVSPTGEIYVGGESGQLYRVGDDGNPIEITSTGGFLLGLACDAEGRVYACDQIARTVWCIDPETGDCAEFAKHERFHMPNWGAFGADGTYYVTDSGSGWEAQDGSVWRRTPDGVFSVWSTQSRNFPNGLALHPFEDKLIIAESNPAAIVEIGIEPDGSAGDRRVLVEMGQEVPDGVAIETDGSLIIACYRPDVIYRWSRARGFQVLAADPQGTLLAAPTNVAFIGPELRDWIVPNLGRWHLTRGGGVRGTPLFYPSFRESS